MAHKKLFLPGPVEVSPEILREMATPMIGHRKPVFSALYEEVQEGLRWLLGTEAPVYLVTASATGVWEMCARNLVRKGCLHLSNGAFSGRWKTVSEANGKRTGEITAPWGQANRDFDALRAALGTGEYDAVAFVHSETSTGVLNPLEAIAEVVREFDDVLLLVDAVSSVTTVPIEVDAHGVDALLFGVQKGVALPPGLACVAVSERAHARAEQAEHRGYYFDLLTYRKYHGRGQTPSTPAISQIMALRAQLARMRAEGLDARYARHRALTERAQAWALERGFGLFAEEGYRTFGLTAVRNDRGADVGAIAKRLFDEHDAVIDQGYGKIKHETFRIAHMGDMQPSELEAYLGWLDAALNG